MRKILKWALVILMLAIAISFAVSIVLYMNYKRNIKTGSVSYNPRINSIYINEDIPVHFKKGNHPHVYYHVNKNNVPRIKDADHVLSLTHSSYYKSHFFLGHIHIGYGIKSNSSEEYITVVLPKNSHHISTLSSNKSTNNLWISNLNIKRIKLNTTDGDIHLSNSKVHDIKVSSSDGDIFLSHLKANAIRALSSDGDVHLSHANTGKSFIHTDDGDVHLFDLRSKLLVYHTNDGDVYAHRIIK